jgi:transposase
MARGYKPYDPHTGSLFPRHLDELVPAEDPVRLVFEATELLELSAFDTRGRLSGQQAFHPLLMVRLLVWAYANGIYSSRKIATAVRRDVTFMWLAGDARPSYRAIIRFRFEHQVALRGLFGQVLRMCAEAGLVRLGHVALDGTVLSANTSKHKAMSYGRMKQEEKRLQQEIEDWFVRAAGEDDEEDAKFGDHDGQSLPEELHRREERLKRIRAARERIEAEARAEQSIPDEEAPVVEDKEQRSFADPEARIMQSKRGGFEYAYNAQIAVDDKAGVIVAAELDNRSPDVEHLETMTEQVREARALVESVPETTQVTADAGYFSSEKIGASEGNGIELLVSPGREGKEAKTPADGAVFDASHFLYDDDNKQLRCPAGRLLVLTDRSDEHFVAQNCDECPLRPQCLKPGETRRHVRLFKRRVPGAIMRARMQQPDAKAVYRRRKCTVEPVFGQIKWARRFRGLSLRGQLAAACEFHFVCAVHNLLKWAARRIAQAVNAPFSDEQNVLNAA